MCKQFYNCTDTAARNVSTLERVSPGLLDPSPGPTTPPRRIRQGICQLLGVMHEGCTTPIVLTARRSFNIVACIFPISACTDSDILDSFCVASESIRGPSITNMGGNSQPAGYTKFTTSTNTNLQNTDTLHLQALLRTSVQECLA